MKSHEAPVTESMQQCIDYIKQNEDEIAEYVNSLFLAQKDVIREQLLESLAAMLNPIPTHSKKPLTRVQTFFKKVYTAS